MQGTFSSSIKPGEHEYSVFADESFHTLCMKNRITMDYENANPV